MANLKETIISSMKDGPEVLADIAAMRRAGKDHSLDSSETVSLTAKYHPACLRLRVTGITDISNIAKTFRLVSESGYLPIFEAGQYINLFVEIDGVRTSRPYSISSSPKQRAYYEITVARIATGFVSDYFLDHVKVGDILEGNGPAGVFHFNPVFHKKKSVFLAGGSGITPFLSMIREASETGGGREIHLIYGARTEDTILYHDELTRMAQANSNFHYSPVLSEAPETYEGRKGFIDAKCIREIAGDIGDATFYLCGPLVMMEFCRKALNELQIPDRRVRQEVFGARQDIQNEPGWPASLTGNEVFKLKANGAEISARAGEPLLVALERAGVRVHVCCRSGECSMCRVRLVSGKVFQPRGVLLRLADEKFGYIHSCKSYPMEDLEIEL